MGECKLGRGTAAKSHKTSIRCASQIMERFNFTRTWRLALDIRPITGATGLKLGSRRSMSMHLCFKVIHFQCVCSQNYQQIILWFYYIYVHLHLIKSLKYHISLLMPVFLFCTYLCFLWLQYKAIDLIWIRAQKAQETLLHILRLHDANLLPSSAMKQNKRANIICNWRCRSFGTLCHRNWWSYQHFKGP